jgi:hypothetical protein
MVKDAGVRFERNAVVAAARQEPTDVEFGEALNPKLPVLLDVDKLVEQGDVRERPLNGSAQKQASMAAAWMLPNHWDFRRRAKSCATLPHQALYDRDSATWLSSASSSSPTTAS